MAFTAIFTGQFEIIENATAGTGGRTTTYRIASVRAEGCDRRNTQVHLVSNDVSLAEILLSPLGATSQLASNLLLILQSNNPVDIKLGTSAAMISGLRSLMAACTCSALFVTTGSNAAMVLTELVGGSAAVITATTPIA